MGDDYAAHGGIESGSSFNADVSPTVFTGHASSGGQGNHRGGYSNLGLQLPATSAVVEEDDEDQDEDDDDETMAGGFVAIKAKSGGRRKNKMTYVGLGDADDDSSALSSSNSSGEEAASDGADGDKTSGRLAIFGLLNLGYVVLQLIGAMAFSSLALMSDGFHNLSDV